MHRLLKIPLAGAVAALVGMLIRRLLDQIEAHGDAGSRAAAAPPPRREPRTRDQLYKEAARLDIKGRSKMNKAELQEAVEMATAGGRV